MAQGTVTARSEMETDGDKPVSSEFAAFLFWSWQTEFVSTWCAGSSAAHPPENGNK